MKQSIIAGWCAIVLSASAIAQDLSGRVLSKDGATPDLTPLPGATIRWLGSTTGTLSRSDGSFSLPRTSAEFLVVSFVGYTPDTVRITSATRSIDIVLIPDLQLEAVRVEAATQTVSNAPLKTELISKHQLERSACCSLAESFEKSPSVEVTFNDAATGAKQIQLLGLRGLYTLTMSEAVPMIRGLATPFGLDYIPGPYVESISISKGAGSVLNGYEGITGQINIEYKKPVNEVPLYVNVYGSSNARGEVNITSARQLSDTWHSLFMVHGGWMQTDRDVNGDGFNDMPMYKNLNAVGRIFHQSDEGTEFQLLTKMIVDDIQSGTVQHSKQNSSNHAFEVGTKATRFEFFSKYAINPLVESPETLLGIQVAGTRHSTQTLIGAREYNGTENMLYSKLILTTQVLPSLNIAYGLSLLVDDFDESVNTIRPVDSTRAFARREFVPGFFSEATLTLDDRLVVVAGLRGDAHNMYGNFLTPRMHIKYSPSDDLSLRLSAGTGMRVANIISDNLSALVNQRNIYIENAIRPERALNFGGSVTASVTVLNLPLTLDAEVYRTVFSNQVVVDFDQSPTSLYIGNLHGSSYSNSALVQMQFSPLDRLDMNLAYRLIDVRTTTASVLQQRPLISPHRLLWTIGYSTPQQLWQFDATLVWNSGGRVPSTASNPEMFRVADRFSSYFRMNAQATKRFDTWDLYLGAENIGNFIQQVAVVSPDDPHSAYFDASLVWGPLDAVFAYAGVRWRFTN